MHQKLGRVVVTEGSALSSMKVIRPFSQVVMTWSRKASRQIEKVVSPLPKNSCASKFQGSGSGEDLPATRPC